MNNKKTSWKLPALVGVASLLVGGGIGSGVAVATTEPEVEHTVTEVDREVTPRVCREAMDDGQRVIDLQAERFEELYMNSPDLDDAKHNLRRTAILLESALEGWDEQSRLCLNNRPE